MEGPEVGLITVLALLGIASVVFGVRWWMRMDRAIDDVRTIRAESWKQTVLLEEIRDELRKK